MLQRQSDHYALLRRSFMMTSLAAAILLISVRGQVNFRLDSPLPAVLPAIAAPPPPIVARNPLNRVSQSRPAPITLRDLPREALHHATANRTTANRTTAEAHLVGWGHGIRNTARLVVDLSDRTVSLYKNGVATQYPIAIGQAGWETPTGAFRIREMNPNPEWEHPITGEVVLPGVSNPLGSRWIGFWSDGTNEIGFHGTNEANLIGLAVSHGCIRMLDDDIQEMYTQVEVGTPVIVHP